MIDTQASPVDATFQSIPPVVVPPRTAMLFNTLALLAVAAAALLPLVVVVQWLSVDAADVAAELGLSNGASFELPLRLGATLIVLAAMAPLCWALLRVRRCFSEFSQGRPFSVRGIAGLRDFALGVALSVVARPLSHGLLTLLFSTQPSSTQHFVAISIDSDTLLLALFSATVWALAWAMEKAAAIAEEHSQFV